MIDMPYYKLISFDFSGTTQLSALNTATSSSPD